MKFCWIALLAANFAATACNKDRNRERTGIDDHPKNNPSVSGMDASGPASGARTNPTTIPPATNR